MNDDVRDLAVPLDQLLTRSGLGTLNQLVPGAAGLRLLASLSRDPQQVARRVGGLAAELGRVALGTSTVSASRADRRFADRAWRTNALLRRVVQAYLAASTTAECLVADADLDWRDAERVQFVVSNLVAAASPSNNPLLSPVAWKALIDSGGASAFTGPRNLVRDFATTPRIPTMVESDAFTVGEDLAITPGAVVHRTEMFELIQYTPQTAEVREVPLLIVPPTINKFYALDLAPGRSLVEYLVQEGQQVFLISWRNPDARHSDWGFDAYAQAMIEAFNVVADITGADSAHTVAACSGGMIGCLAAAHRAAIGKTSRLASVSLLVTMIDQKQAGLVSALTDREAADTVVERSRRKGYLDGRNLAEVFAWLRPNDLIWNYWVNNYLEGKKPPKFDILFWNADTTRMPAALHRDFVDSAVDDKISTPGALTVLGTPIDLSKITVDSYVVAGSADHICPWVNCYRSGQLLGGKVRFVLSSNGHIAALVNPPSNPKSSYRVSEDNSLAPEDWVEAAAQQKGSWWPDYASWLRDRSGDAVPAPTELGNDRYRPLVAAPGAYVLDT